MTLGNCVGLTTSLLRPFASINNYCAFSTNFMPFFAASKLSKIVRKQKGKKAVGTRLAT